MSRGFHAFFRQYYNLRAVLRRTDPTLERLRPLDDYPLRARRRRADSFAEHPAHARREPRGVRRPQPQLRPRGPGRASTSTPPWACSTSTSPRRSPRSTGVSAADVLDRLRFPEAARHLALEVFARSFFADPREFSGAELVAMFHMYFVGSAEGLLFDVPRDDYDSTLWAPLGAHLYGLGVSVVTGREVRSVAELGDGISVLHGLPGHDDQDWLAADAVVLALDPVGLRRVVAASPGLGGDDDAGAAWRESVAGIRSAPCVRGLAAVAVRAGRARAAAVPRHERLRAARQRLGARAVRGPRDPVERRRTAARSSSCTPTRCPRAPTRSTCAQQLLAELHRVYPETAALDGRARRVARRAPTACSSGSSRGGRAPACARPTRGCVLAGDAVRCDLPVALMERAATTGWMAADRLLSGWGLRGHGVWSVPMGSRLGPVPRLARRGIRRLPVGGGARRSS